MNNYWTDRVRLRKLLKERYVSAVSVGTTPNTKLNIRPITTLKGDIVEWQLLIGDPPSVDYGALSGGGPHPTPGKPVMAPTVIRFHKDDVVPHLS